jgi:hypothetical protein
MKKKLPDSIVVPGHIDFEVLSRIGSEIVKRAGGQEALEEKFRSVLRDSIDRVIMTAKTRRRSYEELEKTEKIYIATIVEIELRAMLGVPKGKLDAVILGHDVDIKNTMGNNWMIPTEAIDQICILVAADEHYALGYFGLIVARKDYLSKSENKDHKKSISAAGFANILWLLKEHTYPPNFWRTLGPEVVERIFSGTSGTERMVNLFREVQDIPIGRDVIETVAQQADYMRRIRSDGGRGARDVLANEGILLLSGKMDASLIAALEIQSCPPTDFISHKLKGAAEYELANKHGFGGLKNSELYWNRRSNQ